MLYNTKTDGSRIRHGDLHAQPSDSAMETIVKGVS